MKPNNLRRLARDVAYTEGHAQVMRAAADAIDRAGAAAQATRPCTRCGAGRRRQVMSRREWVRRVMRLRNPLAYRVAVLLGLLVSPSVGLRP